MLMLTLFPKLNRIRVSWDRYDSCGKNLEVAKITADFERIRPQTRVLSSGKIRYSGVITSWTYEAPSPPSLRTVLTQEKHDAEEKEDIPVLYVKTELGHGNVGVCYKGYIADLPDLPVVIKFSGDACKQSRLEKEAAIYEYDLPLIPGINRPTYLGFFEGKSHTAILMGFAGKALKSFVKLNREQK